MAPGGCEDSRHDRTHHPDRSPGDDPDGAQARTGPDARLSGDRQSNVGRVALAAFIVVPFLAVLAAVPVAWGGWLGWRDVVIALGVYAVTGHGISVGFQRLRAIWAMEKLGWVSDVRWLVQSRLGAHWARPHEQRSGGQGSRGGQCPGEPGPGDQTEARVAAPHDRGRAS